eukprot:NODE_9036_length_1451_cov_8.481118.p1 GENE.NODE_9036_length_1451_cov_8.481118~~NODE_9036_length_1451_cov_8.481118.p1  ORF type:complete len:435 (-),score=146.25 NODE_9036_length_1451_cov_8.481118:146-1294(-)
MADFFRVDLWQERADIFDFGGKLKRQLIGHCSVPLQEKFNRRPCTWPVIAARGDRTGTTEEVGYLTLKFTLATTPGQVRRLRLVEGSVGAMEAQLAWDVPAREGGVQLKGYRVEARLLGGECDGDGEGTQTASVRPSGEPFVVLRGLRGNSEYSFRVWAVSEAGPGPGAGIVGRTGAVAPGICGPPSLGLSLNPEVQCSVEWVPPLDGGGALIVGYRIWLRPLTYDRAGRMCAADGFIDLGLFEHTGGPSDVQRVPFRREALPACAGCLCSVSALNAKGLFGHATEEEPLMLGSVFGPDFRLHSDEEDFTISPEFQTTLDEGVRGVLPSALALSPPTSNPGSPSHASVRVPGGGRTIAGAPSWGLGIRGSLVAGRVSLELDH